MKTSIVDKGIFISKGDIENLKEDKVSIDEFLTKYILKDNEVNSAFSQLLANINNTDGGGPVAILKNLEATISDDLINGKVNIFYELKLEWGCSAIKKELFKSEKFDFEINNQKQKLFVYLYIPV